MNLKKIIKEEVFKFLIEVDASNDPDKEAAALQNDIDQNKKDIKSEKDAQASNDKKKAATPQNDSNSPSMSKVYKSERQLYTDKSAASKDKIKKLEDENKDKAAAIADLKSNSKSSSTTSTTNTNNSSSEDQQASEFQKQASAILNKPI